MIRTWRPPFNDEVWKYCLPVLERATDYGMWTTDHYYASLASGHMALWLVDAIECEDDPCAKNLGCFVTELRETAKGRVLWLEAVGGHDFEEAWKAAVSTLDAMAKDFGCYFIELQGRPGLIRKLPDFDHVYVTLRRPVYEQRQ